MSAPSPTGRLADRADGVPRPTCENTESDATTVERPSGARPRAGRLVRLHARLSERDLAVLRGLAKLRLLTGGQVQRMFVADGSPTTKARRARALLQRLAVLGLVVRLGRRVGGVRAGSSGYVYGLSGHGQAVLSIGGPMGGRRRRVWETSPGFQDHVLAVAEMHVMLIEAERARQVEVLSFEAEPACWRRFPGPSGETLVLKPDTYVRLAIGDMEHSAFIEVDLGTESPSTIARKCAVYAAYWRSGVEQSRRGVFPAVLWLVRDATRRTRIATVVAGLPGETARLFRIALMANVVAAVTGTTGGAE